VGLGAEALFEGDVPPVFLLDCAWTFIYGKPYGPRTEPAFFDWIEPFIHFHGKRHRLTSRPAFGT
jgi:hypothetical protein